MNILGITDSITSGAAVVSDGVVVAAVSEERLNRKKMSIGFPVQSIPEVLRIAGLRPDEIDALISWILPRNIGLLAFFSDGCG